MKGGVPKKEHLQYGATTMLHKIRRRVTQRDSLWVFKTMIEKAIGKMIDVLDIDAKTPSPAGNDNSNKDNDDIQRVFLSQEDNVDLDNVTNDGILGSGNEQLEGKASDSKRNEGKDKDMHSQSNGVSRQEDSDSKLSEVD